jgi:hypothetical protein
MILKLREQRIATGMPMNAGKIRRLKNRLK